MHAKHTYMYGMHTGSDVCHMCLVWFAVRRLCLSRRFVLCTSTIVGIHVCMDVCSRLRVLRLYNRCCMAVGTAGESLCFKRKTYFVSDDDRLEEVVEYKKKQREEKYATTVRVN